MNNYNPKQAYFDKRNKTQKSNDRKRDNHQYSSSIGGCSCNYIVSPEKVNIRGRILNFFTNNYQFDY